MAKKDLGLVADRPVISIRPPTDLKQRLEEAAVKSGRSVGREAEHRLEASFEERPPQKLGDPLPGIFSDEVRRYLRSQRDVARLVETIADVSMQITATAKEHGRDEVETRTALRSAIDVIKYWHLWAGETKYPTPKGPRPAPRARFSEMSAEFFGHELATERMLWLDKFREEGVSFDTSEGRIADAYTGNGRGTVFGPTPEEAAARNAEIAEEARRARESGHLQFEDVSMLDRYRSIPRPSDDDDIGTEPATSLKDIMSR